MKPITHIYRQQSGLNEAAAAEMSETCRSYQQATDTHRVTLDEDDGTPEDVTIGVAATANHDNDLWELGHDEVWSSHRKQLRSWRTAHP